MLDLAGKGKKLSLFGLAVSDEEKMFYNVDASSSYTAVTPPKDMTSHDAVTSGQVPGSSLSPVSASPPPASLITKQVPTLQNSLFVVTDAPFE